MNLSLGTRTVLIICYFVQGFVALRLLKVSIPSYKLRGESVFLECQYELDKVRDMSLINSYSPNRDNEPDNSRDDGWTVHRRMRVYQSQANAQLQRHQRQTHYQSSISTNQQKKYEQERAQNQNLYTQQHPSYYAEKNEQRKVYHHQQPQPELTPNQQLYTYPYQTPTSPYGHSIYRGRSSTSVHDVAGVNLYNANTYRGWGESSRSVSSFGQMERDNSFAESTEHDDEEDKEEDNEEEEGEALYAIKWYKDNEEFYRYVPKAKPPKTSYRVDGVRVIEEHSDSSRVLLRGLTINSTGLYRCEISAEAPNFSSVEAEGHMDVVYLPRDGPYIRGQQSQYQIGETLDLNCTSGKSHPASHLQWFINDEAVVEKLNLIKYNDTIHRHGLITSTLGLEKMVEAENFHKGAMRVKCVASLSPVLWKGDKESVLQRRRPGLIDNREAMLLVHSSAPTHNKIDGSLALFIVLTITAFPRAFHRLSLLPTLL